MLQFSKKFLFMVPCKIRLFWEFLTSSPWNILICFSKAPNSLQLLFTSQAPNGYWTAFIFLSQCCFIFFKIHDQGHRQHWQSQDPCEKRINSGHTSERSWPFPVTTVWDLWLPFLCTCHCAFLHQWHETSLSSSLTYWYCPTTDKTQSNAIWAGDGIICNAQKSLLMFKCSAILKTLLSLTGIFIFS